MKRLVAKSKLFSVKSLKVKLIDLIQKTQKFKINQLVCKKYALNTAGFSYLLTCLKL
jgi:hypothetical protein